VFEHEWSHQMYSMLREAHIEGDTIVFPATSMDEVERHHLRQLKIVLDRVNRETARLEEDARAQQRRDAERKAELEREHAASIDRVMERLNFDQ